MTQEEVLNRSALERTAMAIAQSCKDVGIKVRGDGQPNGPIWLLVDRLEGSEIVTHRYLLQLVPDDE
jgi:hypothetical protein